ncbi:DNA-binding protein [Providencia vermicola]|uniref:DNA-binding protein n=2 Tax=Morganellaceae TaxID=1903414 RepID=UPI0019825ABC|nr:MULTISPECIES: DNA-binding protein [Providencia]MBN4864853.1 putative DNA-binding transcriptional regulator [Providencia stuartii]MBN4873701.1 putative DNA-binding transcriptional regulator [Providencia stuartii]MBN4878392.1 putative DNA-binding transcriptional regulator [Providencia stuartii]MBN4883375.1 putative DNA-binding transcriptional regulator [Providencia stuartii]USR64715.1 putative DNA-binding transcriptional regulator [Providencia stuartii]
MKKLWFTAKELAGLEGLPTSPQGVNLMARREGWKHRRKRGVQGKAVEYYIESLPGEIQGQLSLCEPSVPYQSQRTDALQIWSEAYYQLTETERNKIVKYILRYGLSSLLAQIAEDEKGEK